MTDNVREQLRWQWGPWRLDLGAACAALHHIERPADYWLALDRFRTAADVLRTIQHLATRSWPTDRQATVLGFVRAVDDILDVTTYRDGSVTLTPEQIHDRAVCASVWAPLLCREASR